MATSTMFTHDFECPNCFEMTTFEYSSAPYFGNGWDECDEGAEDFAIQGARGCLNAASVAAEHCDEEDICTLTDEQLTDKAHDDLSMSVSSSPRRWRY